MCVFFSDAVYAIAITLLVIDLRVPDLPGDASTQAIADALLQLAPRFYAFALSFAVIGMYWLTHWRRFQLIERVNQRLVVINLILLGSVVFIPFPTSLIAQFGDSLSTAFYAVAIATTGLLEQRGVALRGACRPDRPAPVDRDRPALPGARSRRAVDLPGVAASCSSSSGRGRPSCRGSRCRSSRRPCPDDSDGAPRSSSSRPAPPPHPPPARRAASSPRSAAA